MSEWFCNKKTNVFISVLSFVSDAELIDPIFGILTVKFRGRGGGGGGG